MSCWDDFSTLREVVVGRGDFKPVALHDEPATRDKLGIAFDAQKSVWRKQMLEESRKAGRVIDCPIERRAKCLEQVEDFCNILRENDVDVLRPEQVPGWEEKATTPWWSINYHYGTPCPRDLFIKFGDLVVETFSGWRCRYFESQAYYQILNDHCERTGSRHVTMPRGILADDLYDGENGKIYSEHCGVIEAADIRRFGRDAFMQTGGYSNEKGFEWLQRLLKHEDIHLNKMTFDNNLTQYYHLDAKFTAINENTILYAPGHKPSEEIFKLFQEADWNLVEAPFREVLVSPEDFCCSGLNLNMLVLGPSKMVIDEGEKSLHKFLQDEGCDAIGMDFSSAFEFGGAFNCWTFDTIRDGGDEKYFS